MASGGSALQIAVDGLNSSKPKDINPGGRSHVGYGLFTVKRLIELNRGRMTVISGSECVTLNKYETKLSRLSTPWQGTIVALVIELVNPLPLEDVYEEEHARIVGPRVEMRGPVAAVSSKPVTRQAPESPSTEAAPDKVVLTIRDFSTKLLARETGLAIRAELATLLVDRAVVEVDLDGVEDITPSVADECFGKLALRLGESKFKSRIIFRGGAPLLHRLIEFVVANRLSTSHHGQQGGGAPPAPFV